MYPICEHYASVSLISLNFKGGVTEGPKYIYEGISTSILWENA
jgi:hypothetical protein